jgi:hypothetical protein
MLAVFLCISPAALIAAERTSSGAYHKHYSFKKDSFTDKITAWSKILHEFKGKAGVHYLEIGTYEGRSALWMLENILTHPTAKLTIIDAFQENTQKTFMSNVKLSGEAGKFTVLPGLSTERIREVAFNSIDLAYIDGSGKGIVMLTDLVNTWNLVKVGGVIICSQYTITGPLRRALGLRPEDPGPREAMDAFLTMYGPYVSVLAMKGNYVVVRKRRA